MRIDHVQLTMPEGQEDEARRFYGRLLEMPEVPKPESLRARGGCWFRTTGCEIHVGVEPSFQPQRKAHPAFSVPGLDALARRLRDAGIAVEWSDALPGVSRFFANDPFGNRIEFVAEGTGLRDVSLPVTLVCGALLRVDRVLMVRRNGLDGDYWALPGGSIERDERPEDAVVREVLRETGHTVEVSRVLWDAPVPNRHGMASGSVTRCFLVVPAATGGPTTQGTDAERRDPDPPLPSLVSAQPPTPDVDWLRLDEVRSEPQVSRVLDILQDGAR